MNEIICHDCKFALGEGEKYYVYNYNGKEYYKCKQCYESNKALSNFQPCEVYSRICGYYQPTKTWNPGKLSEFESRTEYKLDSL